MKFAQHNADDEDAPCCGPNDLPGQALQCAQAGDAAFPFFRAVFAGEIIFSGLVAQRVYVERVRVGVGLEVAELVQARQNRDARVAFVFVDALFVARALLVIAEVLHTAVLCVLEHLVRNPPAPAVLAAHPLLVHAPEVLAEAGQVQLLLAGNGLAVLLDGTGSRCKLGMGDAARLVAGLVVSWGLDVTRVVAAVVGLGAVVGGGGGRYE